MSKSFLVLFSKKELLAFYGSASMRVGTKKTFAGTRARQGDFQAPRAWRLPFIYEWVFGQTQCAVAEPCLRLAQVGFVTQNGRGSRAGRRMAALLLVVRK